MHHFKQMSSEIHTSHSYSAHNRVQLISGGIAYFNLLKNLIEKAVSTIYIRIYIWDDDQTGTMIADALIRAAKRNVDVYILADGYASQCLSKKFIKRLRDHGIHFRYFEPLFKSNHFYFGRRMHEKIVVIDQSFALVGGINFADRYNDIDDRPAWLDYALYLEGEAVNNLYEYCATGWNDKKYNHQSFVNKEAIEEPCSVRISRNDWVKRNHEIWRTYFNWFNQAEESITVMCSYFLPGSVLRSRLSRAAKRGVKVKVILAGPSDVMLAKYAERYLYSWMLKNSIEIYEYQPTVLHAKMMVVDNHWVTVGSYNINNISTYASLELNLDVRNKPFAQSVQKIMDGMIAHDCIQITERNFMTNATFFKQFIQRGSYELIRLILNLSTFYFKPE